MAREATKYELYGYNSNGDIRNFTIASNAAIVVGTIMKFADPRTISASTGTADMVAGIAAMEHNGTDYSTTCSVYTNGIFKLTASGAITAGDRLVTAIPGNYVKSVVAETNVASASIVIGYALETATADQTLLVRVGPL